MKNKKKKDITPFYVIHFNFNARVFEKYDIMQYLIDRYNEAKRDRYQNTPVTHDEFDEFVRSKSMNMYWARCEYEVLLQDWPCKKTTKKIDIYWQILNNIDLVVRLLMENVGASEN